MGLSASQARLLSITARLSDNEMHSQAIAYAKQRLADETEQVNTAYNNALSATKLTVLTGFNGTEANYTDISYDLMTGYNTVACGKQYVVTDQKGRILVSQKYADAYRQGNGDFNYFLEQLGYSQCDVDFASLTTTDEKDQVVHDAWDRYLDSVGKGFEFDEHDTSNPDIKYGYYNNTTVSGGVVNLNEYAYYVDNSVQPAQNIPISYDGNSVEQRELYDYAVALTKARFNNTGTLKSPVTDIENANYIKYLRNIYTQMKTFGFVTTQDDLQKSEADTIKDNSWFEDQLKKGKLLLKSYSATDNAFVAANVSEDDAIQEVQDETKIAKAERDYEQSLTKLEAQDEKFDLELNRLDTEHNALNTEFESLQKVIEKNVTKSFNLFS